MNNNLSIIDVLILTLFILLIGASIGVMYDDGVWKDNLNTFSDDNTKFRFNNSGTFYTIQKYEVNSISQTNFSNLTIP
jgi:hypothetical protein